MLLCLNYIIGSYGCLVYHFFAHAFKRNWKITTERCPVLDRGIRCQHWQLQYIPRNKHAVFALLCFLVVIHWLIFPYLSSLLHWHCGNLTIAPVPAKQPWWIWINTSCEFIMNDCITTTKQRTTKPCAYFLGYTVLSSPQVSRAEGRPCNNVSSICIAVGTEGMQDPFPCCKMTAECIRQIMSVHKNVMPLKSALYLLIH